VSTPLLRLRCDQHGSRPGHFGLLRVVLRNGDPASRALRAQPRDRCRARGGIAHIRAVLTGALGTAGRPSGERNRLPVERWLVDAGG